MAMLRQTFKRNLVYCYDSLIALSLAVITCDVMAIWHTIYNVTSIEWGEISLQISKTLGSGRKKRTKSATATTDLMLGMMDLKIGKFNVWKTGLDCC